MWKNEHIRSRLIIFIILCGITLFFIYPLAKNKTEFKGNIKEDANSAKIQFDTSKEHPDETKMPSQGRDSLKDNGINTKDSQIPKSKNGVSPYTYSGRSGIQKIPLRGNKPNLSDFSEDIANSNLNVSLADISYYDPFRRVFVLKQIDLYSDNKDVSTPLLSALKILNKKGMPQDYYRWEQYKSAYNEIDDLCPDVYIWPYFTNKEAKINYFLFLFTRYAEDNKNWRPYEKDISDCSQFSQRIYLFLQPDDVVIEDEDYFYFLFSNGENRAERKKACNKIPNIFYTIATAYLLKKETSKLPVSSHAMISFVPDSNLAGLIIGEPQTGAFETYVKNIGYMLNEELAQYPLICRLGKILSIPETKGHEAEIEEMGGYFLPTTFPNGPRYKSGGLRQDYGEEPIMLTNHTYKLFQTISSYLRQVLNGKMSARLGLLNSLEDIELYRNVSHSQIEDEIKSSVDIIMHGLIDLDSSDIRRIQDEMKDLKRFTSQQQGIPSQVRTYIAEIHHLFQLKLEPLLAG